MVLLGFLLFCLCLQIFIISKPIQIIKNMGNKAQENISEEYHWVPISKLNKVPGNPIAVTHHYQLIGEKYFVTSQQIEALYHRINRTSQLCDQNFCYSHITTRQDSQYQRRKGYSENVVKVLDYKVISLDFQSNSANALYQVVTERVPCRLHQLSGITKKEGFYILYNALKGYRAIYKNGKLGFIDAQMIGFTSSASIRVWINTNWAINYPSNPIPLSHQDWAVDETINIIQNQIVKLEKQGFGQKFRSRYKLCKKSFNDVIALLQGYYGIYLIKKDAKNSLTRKIQSVLDKSINKKFFNNQPVSNMKQSLTDVYLLKNTKIVPKRSNEPNKILYQPAQVQINCYNGTTNNTKQLQKSKLQSANINLDLRSIYLDHAKKQIPQQNTSCSNLTQSSKKKIFFNYTNSETTLNLQSPKTQKKLFNSIKFKDQKQIRFRSTGSFKNFKEHYAWKNIEKEYTRATISSIKIRSKDDLPDFCQDNKQRAKTQEAAQETQNVFNIFESYPNPNNKMSEHQLSLDLESQNSINQILIHSITQNNELNEYVQDYSDLSHESQEQMNTKDFINSFRFYLDAYQTEEIQIGSSQESSQTIQDKRQLTIIEEFPQIDSQFHN